MAAGSLFELLIVNNGHWVVSSGLMSDVDNVREMVAIFFFFSAGL